LLITAQAGANRSSDQKAPSGRALEAGASDPAEKAQQLAVSGDWGGAIDTYAKFLRTLGAEEYRDKKDFAWILGEYEKRNPGDYAAFKKIAANKLEEHKGDALFTWRLH